ncbi:hypothetical protein ACWEQP_23515 [Streptomyces sp. NPDC004044]
MPPRTQYEVTPLGGTWHTRIRASATWTEEHLGRIAVARAACDALAAVIDNQT